MSPIHNPCISSPSMLPRTFWIAILIVAVPAAVAAQERLALDDAIARARSRHPSALTASIAEREAALKVDEARAALYPRVDAVESWQRGNLPVFAFSSLLSQRRFKAQNFDISSLNNPDPLDNFRAALSVEQVIFDGAIGPSIKAAELGREAAAIRRQQTGQDLATAAVDAYGRVLLFEALASAARAGVEAAVEDARRARDRYEVGTATQADVLSIDVHAAAMRERDIQARTEARIARTRLNELIGAPLDAQFALDGLPPVVRGAEAVPALEAEALEARPDIRLSTIEQRTAEAAIAAARSAFLPQLAFRGGWEWNGGTFGTREGGWLVGTEVRWNVFRGLGNRARLKGAEVALERHGQERQRIETAARLDVRAAAARLDAAEARREVAQAVVSQAAESRRITRDRYEQGLADAAALLQAAQAVLDAEAQEIAARVDALVRRAALDRAVGR
jgi:outer membrane protein